MTVVAKPAVRPTLVEPGEDVTSKIPIVVSACPGNGARYLLVLTPIDDEGAARELGCGVPSVVVSLWPGEKRLSSSAVFKRAGGYLAPTYVAEKLRVNDVDAVALATILGELLDRPHPGTDR